jgi:hypothetical protein
VSKGRTINKLEARLIAIVLSEKQGEKKLKEEEQSSKIFATILLHTNVLLGDTEKEG